ncbi:hypothetical protein G4G27_11690 [Sphingomonas sp. So64.6b]|uniref:hypothetical protein n=1 Tax=Sphingomonas sp. So64.6b TaxID=2997354 RepID=UPI001600FF86|nr:hypothetical protein [Sphingomonas sp. So64.6b]QNA84578.1 hypothetical protein G4G27_11690 [Sphingomonas sp. So64.6b]
MNLSQIKRLIAEPYEGILTVSDDVECLICNYLGNEFWVYLMPGDSIEQIVLSFISNGSADLSADELNEFNDAAHVGRMFLNSDGFLNLNAKYIGRFQDLTPKSFVMFMEAWMDDFDRMLPKLNRFSA